MSISSRSVLLLAAALVAAVALGATPAAQARSFVIKARGSQTTLGEVRAIGDFKPSRNPRLGAAIRAYGEPTSRRGGGEICTVRWADLGVKIVFVNFGGFDSCKRRGLAQKAVVSGDRPWRTARGLRLGDSTAKAMNLYPRAKETARGLRLAQGILPFGIQRRYAVLGARVDSGRVEAFTLFIGAAGD
jgi:hypothetical protein